MALIGRNAADPLNNYGDLGVAAAPRNVTPQAPVRIRQITPKASPHPESKEFFVNAIAAGEARESSLARLPETSAWRVPRRGSDECWTD